MRDLVVYGLGELGQLYGGAALRAGLRVTPITRASDPRSLLSPLAPEVPILVAVDERALEDVLSTFEPARSGQLILLQNELFPSQYEALPEAPTVFVPWLLKKRGMPLLVARETPVFGRFSALVCELHAALGLPAVALGSERELHRALVEKYAFIITINALGVLRDRTLSMWLQEDPLRVRALSHEAAKLGAELCGSEVDSAACIHAVEEAMRALGAMGARGRTAPERVARALAHGERLGLALPELARVAREAR
jgi:hypothetical protein